MNPVPRYGGIFAGTILVAFGIGSTVTGLPDAPEPSAGQVFQGHAGARSAIGEIGFEPATARPQPDVGRPTGPKRPQFTGFFVRSIR